MKVIIMKNTAEVAAKSLHKGTIKEVGRLANLVDYFNKGNIKQVGSIVYSIKKEK